MSAAQTVLITANGSVSVTWDNSPNKYQTPDGYPRMSTSDPGFHVPFLAPGLTPWSLVGKIGDNGKPFQVGSKNAITPQSAGELYLSVNDNNFGDNSGSWNVTVQLARGARGSLSPVRYVVLGVAILVFVGLATVVIKLTIPRHSNQ